jgi:hypothetical protein
MVPSNLFRPKFFDHVQDDFPGFREHFFQDDFVAFLQVSAGVEEGFK